MTSDLGELVVSTRFSSIYKNKARALKVTHVESVAKPHDPMCELAILRKLQVGRSAHIIELVSFEVARGVVTLQFPFYKQNMYQYILKYYQKRRWNPYLLTEQGDSGSKLANNLKIDYALDFFRQLADALSNLHEHKIIHRDVKLQNVMVDEDGPHDIPQLVLIDFGIAYDPETSQEAADSKITDVSTSIYKAPELLFSVKNYSSAADIWSLMVLVSQLFQTESSSDRFIPALVSDGSEVLEQGSDIRLVSSIFEKLGIPSLQEWPEVRDYGSPAFEGMFGTAGDGHYILNQTTEIKRQTCMQLFPRLEELTEPVRSNTIECLLRMMPYESAQRASAREILTMLV